jgi:hypothetical protein
MTRKLLSLVSLGSILTIQVLGFGTGSHFDLTRNVLAEHNFKDTAIKIAQVENWLTDYYAYSPTNTMKHREVLDRLHFDNLYTDGQVRTYWAALLNNLKALTEKAAREDDKMALLVLLGLGLHSVQDFYAHSNWAELHRSKPEQGFRTETFWRMANAGAIPKSLHTGKFPDDRTEGPGSEDPPRKADVHGGNADGLNKDSPDRPGWDEAYVFAYAASHELVSAMEEWAEAARPGFWGSVRQHSVDVREHESLEKDLLAARNMSMWLKGKGKDGTWKGDGSGTQRLFSQFSAKWVTADTSDFVKAVRDGKLQNGLMKGLYEKRRDTTLPEVVPFNLQRNAVMVRITEVNQTRNSNLLVRLSREGSDYYSRITFGEQEFWGRTLQSIRQADNPWYEIYFADANRAEISITMSVWDEDSIDPKEDEHVDIDPRSRDHDLKFVLRVSDGVLSGDLNGIFDSPKQLFRSEGGKPETDWARIQGYVATRRLLVSAINK